MLSDGNKFYKMTEKNCCKMNEVHIIQQGYSFIDGEGKYRATGSSTLVKTSKHVIIVDTGSPRERDKILQGLKKFGVKTEDVDHVIGTHGHVDHVGNLNLFSKAVYIVGNDICESEDIYKENSLKKGDSLTLEADQVVIIPTAGHTNEDISVVVYNTRFGTVVIAGDLFECENDNDCWKDVSQFPDQQARNRDKVQQIADWIIPGHGGMFKVKKQ
jgi:glyoxylase-like metal-dependent hydrolase (beta-lactamase superfamily II)